MFEQSFFKAWITKKPFEIEFYSLSLLGDYIIFESLTEKICNFILKKIITSVSNLTKNNSVFYSSFVNKNFC